MTDDFGEPSYAAPVVPGRARPGFGEAILLLLLMLVATVVASVAIFLGNQQAASDLLFLGVVEGLAIAFGLLVGVRIADAGAAEIFLLRRVPGWMLLASVPLAAAAALLTATLEGPLIRVVPMPDDIAFRLAQLLCPGDAGGWLRVMLVVVIVAGVGEELLFRGLFLRGFMLRYGRGPALALSSLLFAVVHLNPWGFASIFLAGWLLGWLVLRSGSLWPAILVHGVYNLSSVLLLVVSIDGKLTPDALAAADAGIWASPAAVVTAAIALVVLLLCFSRHGRRAPPWTLDG